MSDLYRSSLDKLQEGSLYQFSMRALYTRPLSKISRGHLYTKSVGKISIRHLYIPGVHERFICKTETSLQDLCDEFLYTIRSLGKIPIGHLRNLCHHIVRGPSMDRHRAWNCQIEAQTARTHCFSVKPWYFSPWSGCSQQMERPKLWRSGWERKTENLKRQGQFRLR